MGSSPHFSSWQKMRKELKSFLAPSLARRVDYMATSYRKAPDSLGHAEILVDGQPVANHCCYKQTVRKYRQPENYDPVMQDFCECDFIHAAGWYLTNPIEESLSGVECEDKSNPRILTPNTATLRRCLAVMDRRVGKRTLRRLAGEMRDAPPILRYFYALRCEAEGIAVESDVPNSKVPQAPP